MASLVLGAVGAVIGSAFGAPQIGFMLGSALGSALFGPSMPDTTQEGPRLSNLAIQDSAYGKFVPIIYGQMRTSGNLIWAQDIQEHEHVTETETGGKGGGGGTATTRTYTYTCSFAVSLGEGTFTSYRRIWMDSTLVYDETGVSPVQSFQATSMASYMGTLTQDPDPTIEAIMGVGNTPAYRGQGYIVFTDLELADFGNRIPNITVEVVRKMSVPGGASVTSFPTDSEFGGDTLVYNPDLQELWGTMSSTFTGFARYDPETGASLGYIDTSSVAATMESGIFGNPTYDPVNKRVYVITFGPRRLLYINTETATIEGNWNWDASGLQYFDVSPVDGNVWATFFNGGGNYLQERDAVTGTTGSPVAITGSEVPLILIDSDNNVWLLTSTWLKRYNTVSGTFDVTHTDTENFYGFAYDSGRHSVWYFTQTNPNYTVASISDFSLADPGVITYSVTSGPGFTTGEVVTVNGVTGLDELFGATGEYSFVATVLDSTHMSIGIDTSGMTAYVSDGSMTNGNRRVKEYDIATDTVVTEVGIAPFVGGSTKSLVYDPVSAYLWVGIDGNTTMNAIDTTTGEVVHLIPVPPSYYPFWVARGVNGDMWMNPSTYDTYQRIRLGAESSATGDVTLGAIVADISDRCNLPAERYDVSRLTRIVDGYAIPSLMNGRAAIEPLANAYAFDNVESGRKVKFVLRGGEVVALIPYHDLVNSQ